MSTKEQVFYGGGGDGEDEQDCKPSPVESSETAGRAKVKLIMSRLIPTVLNTVRSD